MPLVVWQCTEKYLLPIAPCVSGVLKNTLAHCLMQCRNVVKDTHCPQPRAMRLCTNGAPLSTATYRALVD